MTNPDPVCVALARPLTWEIEGDGKVTIDFKDQGGIKGPFRHDPTSSPHNIRPGVYVREAGDKHAVRSNAAEHVGVWIYNVKWELPGKPPLTTPDPVICVRR